MVEGSFQPQVELSVDQNKGVKSSGFATLLMISTALVVLFTAFLMIYNFSLSRQVTDLNGQKSALISQIKTPDNQKIEALINGTADSISSLKILVGSDQYKLSNLMVDLPKVVNKNVVINNFSLDSFDHIRIDGVTNNQTSLAKFMQSLQDSVIFKNVSLAATSNNGSDAKTATTFSISLDLDRTSANESIQKTVSSTTSTDTTTSTTAAGTVPVTP